MFPLQFVEGLVGSEAPLTKEALAFQLALSSSDKAKAKPVSAKWVSPQYPTMPTNSSGRQSLADIRASEVITVSEDPKYNFIEFAKKHFATPKRPKTGSYGKTTLSRLTGTAVSATSRSF